MFPLVLAYLALMMSFVFPPALLVAVPLVIFVTRRTTARYREIRADEEAARLKAAAKVRAKALRMFA